MHGRTSAGMQSFTNAQILRGFEAHIYEGIKRQWYEGTEAQKQDSLKRHVDRGTKLLKPKGLMALRLERLEARMCECAEGP